MAPKIISEHERVQTKQAIITHTKQLISLRRGIKNITVDDIVHSVGMGKGSFYAYFPSKEACIYEVIEHTYKTDLAQFEAIMKEDLSLTEKVKKFLWDVFLAEGGIDRYMVASDYEMILRKLPSEYIVRDERAYEQVIMGMMRLLNLDRFQLESLTVLLDCISYVATQTTISKAVKNVTLDTLILAVADYVEKSVKTEEH